MDKHEDKKGQVVWLAGLPLVLHYTINSLCAMEARADMPLDELMHHHFSATRLLLWAGLRQNYRYLTVWDAGELITEHLQRGGTLQEVIELCADSLRASGLLEEEKF
ncbi:MAG: hypothetical protein IJI59_16440 [Clostridia bacterium]|nr:hypothetical protein [Clostridia bacterium]